MPQVGPDFLELFCLWVLLRVGTPLYGVTFDLCHAPSIGLVEAFQLTRWWNGRHNLAGGEVVSV